MKKLIALFFLSILCLAAVPGAQDQCRMSYVLAESGEAEAEKKESKEEIKELITVAPTHPYLAPPVTRNLIPHTALFPPRPVLDKHTPPPDAGC